MRIGSVLALAHLLSAAQAPVLPDRTGFVNDFANVIAPAREAAIARILDELYLRSGGEIVVVTLRSLQGRSAEEMALRIRTEWGIGRGGRTGDPARNVGVVVLLVPASLSADGRDHLEIETGLRASTFITAEDVARIAQSHMTPAFRDGEYGSALLRGVAALAVEYAEHFDFELTGDPPVDSAAASAPSSGSAIMFLIIVAVGLLLALAFLSRSPRFRRPGGGPTAGSGS